MKEFVSVIFIPSCEREATTYLSLLVKNEPELLYILSQSCPGDCSAVSKLRHLIKVGACEEMSAAQNEAFEKEIARYEIKSGTIEE